jgi:ABC-type transport system substrate-binding protein
MKELHMMLNDDLPYIFLWSLDIYSGLSRRVTNIFIQPYSYYTFFKDWMLK